MAVFYLTAACDKQKYAIFCLAISGLFYA